MVPPGRLYTKDRVLAGRAAGVPLKERINEDAAAAARGGDLGEALLGVAQSHGADTQRMHRRPVSLLNNNQFEFYNRGIFGPKSAFGRELLRCKGQNFGWRFWYFRQPA